MLHTSYISSPLTLFASHSHTLLSWLMTLEQALHASCQSADGCVSQLSRRVVTTSSLELLQTETSLRLTLLSQFGYSQRQHRHYRHANQTRRQHGGQLRAARSTLHLWRITYIHTHRQDAACWSRQHTHGKMLPPKIAHTNTYGSFQAVLHETSAQIRVELAFWCEQPKGHHRHRLTAAVEASESTWITSFQQVSDC